MSPKRTSAGGVKSGGEFRHPKSRAAKRSKIEAGRQKRIEIHQKEHLKKLRPTLLKLKYFKQLVLENLDRTKWTREQLVDAAEKYVSNYKEYVPCGYKPGTFAFHEYEEALFRIKKSFENSLFEVPDLTNPNVVKALLLWKTKEEKIAEREECMNDKRLGKKNEGRNINPDSRIREEGIIGTIKMTKVGKKNNKA